ncbi:MAG: hypothetical protein ACW99A_12005 [Candidatus Kariarchaeaceae archaeon]|jgi:hypothetical protein
MEFTFGKEYFTDEQIIEYVNTHTEYVTTFSIVNPNTKYHYLSPVWSIYHNGYFYFSTDDNNMKSNFVQKNDTKVGLNIIEPASYPIGRAGLAPYVSISGTAKIRRKEEFENYRKIIDLLYDKFDKSFPSKESKEKWISHIMNDSETRVLMEIKVEKTFIFEHYEKAAREQEEK